MPMKTKVILLTVISILFLNGCEKVCSGFPDEYAGYLPYSYNQQIKFNNNKDTITFQIYHFHLSISNKISTCGMCECGYPINGFNAAPLEKDFFFEELSVENKIINPNLMSSYIRFIYDKTEFSPNDCFEQNNSIDSETDTIIINNLKPTRISKVIIVKGKGIISFYDITTNSEWKLIEK